MKQAYKALFFPNKYYHVFNHAVGRDKLFVKPDNYRYFLHLFDKHICPVAEILCYCLLPNHFHFLLATKTDQILQNRMEVLQYKKKEAEMKQPAFVLQQFSNLFNADTKALNKQQGRMGKLFLEPFNRRLIDSSSYYINLVHYVHANPVHHGFSKKVEEWPYTSCQSIINGNKWLQYEEVIAWFGSLNAFIAFHQRPVERKF